MVRFYGLLLLPLLLQACGGGSGGRASNEGNGGTASTQSSSSALSSSALSAYAYPQTTSGKEDEQTSIKLNINISGPAHIYFKSENIKDPIFTDKSKMGGELSLIPGETTVTYTPKEDFNGDDEFSYYITPIPVISEPQKITVTLHIQPVKDNLKIKRLDSNILTTGQEVVTSLWYDPDTNISMQPDSSTKIYFNHELVTTYNVVNGTLRYAIPNLDRADTYEYTIEQQIAGNTEKETFIISTKIVKDNYEIYQGNESAPGQTIAIVMDKDEQPTVIENWKRNNLDRFIEQPVVKAFRHYWNVIYFTKQPDEAIAPDATITKSETLARFIHSAIPNFGIQIILSSNITGAWASGNTIGANIKTELPTFQHELGHAHAHMADEYQIDNPGECTEGANPNLTHFNTPDAVPWKHWIDNKESIPGITPGANMNGVGIFTGGICNNIYRPMFNAVMRNGNILGPVYTEAWGLASYKAMGFLETATTQKQGNIQKIIIHPTLDLNITQADWYLDGMLQPDWHNQNIIQIDEATLASNQYSIKIILTDLTGYIRNPNAYAVFNNKENINPSFQRTWSFTKD